MKRIVCLLALLTAFSLTAGVRGFQEKLSATEIINKHLAAAGGKEALAKIKTRVAIGTVKRENQAEVQALIMSEAPDRVALAYSFQDSTWRLIYDKGKQLFRPSFTREYNVVEDKYREMLASGFFTNGIALYNALLTEPAPDAKIEARGTKKINGRLAYVVEYKCDKKANVVRLCFDAENFMWVRSEFGRVTIPQQIGALSNDVQSRSDDQPTADFYVETADFREVDGLKLPHKLIQVVTFPILRQRPVGTLTVTINEYKQNVAIDPKMFQ